MKLGIIGSGNIVVDCLDAVKIIEAIELAVICVREKSTANAKAWYTVDKDKGTFG